MDLLEKNLASPETSVADELTKASILAAQPRRSTRRDAIKILEDVAARHPDQFSSDDRFQLASLYYADGEWDQWRRAMVQVLGSQSRQNHQHMAAYAAGLLARGATSEAELYIDRLQELAPESPSTVELQLQLWFARTRYADVLKLLKKRVDQSSGPAGSPDGSGRRVRDLLWAARQLESFGSKLAADSAREAQSFLTLAEQAYRLAQEKDPAAILQWALFHARQGHDDETWQILRTPDVKLTAKQTAEIARTIFARASEAQLAQLQSYLEDAVQADPTATPLRLVLADLLNRTDPQRAAAHYRDVLKDDPRSVIAMNNLAMLLALEEGDTAQAAALMRRAVQIAGPLGALLDTQGVMELAAGRPERALAEFDRALDEGETASRRFHQAQALLALARPAEAKEAFRRSLELGLTADRLFPVERKSFEQLEQRFAEVAL
jgi:tetratricopeptide (TPR) repeat protein